MNRWTRINLMLAVLVAGLLGLHLWPTTPTQPALTGLAAEQVSSIRVERGDRLRIALQRKQDAWQLTYPHQADAKTERVRQLLAIARAPVQQTFPATADLSRYGLDRPHAVLQLDQLRLQFGDRDPAQESRYVLVEDDIRVIDELYFNLLNLPASHFTTD
jgi:hypothetical protein